MSLPTLFPLSCDPIQYRIGLAISDHLKSQFDIVESLIIKGDLQTSEFIIDKLKIFSLETELAYQSEFPLIDSYLVYIRNLFNLYLRHPDYWESRIKAFHALVDSFKSLNEIAFSEVEHIYFTEVELPSEESETVSESDWKKDLSLINLAFIKYP